MHPKYLALLLIPFSSLLLAGTPAPDISSAQAQTTLTRLVLRDHEITISRGANGTTLYDVHRDNGQALDVALNVTQLQAKYPSIYDSLQPAIARGAADPNLMLMMEHRDASDF